MMKMFQSYIPHARLAEVAGAGHSVYFERPDTFNRLVDEFLSEVDARPVGSPTASARR